MPKFVRLIVGFWAPPRRWGIPSPEGERKCSDGGIRFRRDETVDI